jgi:hypothetical protein
VGDLKIPPQLQFQITKHLNLAFFELKLKIFCGCFGFGDFKVDKDPQCMGDLLISTLAPISNHRTSKFSLLKFKTQYVL